MRFSIFLPLLALASAPVLADTWGGRLVPTVDSIDRETWSTFALGCMSGGYYEVTMPKYRSSGNANPKMGPRKTCLQGIFQKTRYFRRHKDDPIAYRTADGKPYLELFFSGAGKYVEKDYPKEPPEGNTRYSLKVILHDFNGTGRYPILHEQDTFKPRYDVDKPIARTEAGTPYLNYAEGRGIPLIIGNFAAMRETPAVTFSSGARLYGDYTNEQLDKIFPDGKVGGKHKLGEVVVKAIGKDGKIDGSFSFRMLQESCTDPLAVSDCRVITNHVHGNFTAEPFKPNKQGMQAVLDSNQAKDPVVKPRLKLKPKLTGSQTTGQTSSSYYNTIIIDVPQPRLHKPLLGQSCGGDIARTCGHADNIFDDYLACMDKNNFAKNKTSDTAQVNAAKQALQGCADKYNDYAQKSRQCKKLFINSETCTE